MIFHDIGSIKSDAQNLILKTNKDFIKKLICISWNHLFQCRSKSFLNFSFFVNFSLHNTHLPTVLFNDIRLKRRLPVWYKFHITYRTWFINTYFESYNNAEISTAQIVLSSLLSLGQVLRKKKNLLHSMSP